MAPSVTSTPEHALSVPDQAAPNPTSNPAPNKKKPPRSTALADAKKILRAASAVTSKSLAAPEFVHRPPDIARHRRKCAVCHHPERETIEDLFIHWHSPNTISEYYEDDADLTWVSIYRHAYAFGLDELRRRNLRFAFELIIEQAADIVATPAAIIASARALGTCVGPDGHWNDPPKRVLVTNIVRNESSQSAPAVVPAPGSATNSEPAAFSDEIDSDNISSSYRASFPRDVMDSVAPSSAASAAETVGASRRPLFDSASETEIDAVEHSSFRADYPHEAVGGGSAASATADPQPDGEDPSLIDASKHSSYRASHPRDVVDSPALSSETSAAEIVGAALRRPQFDSASETRTGIDKDASYRALYPREVVASQSNSAESISGGQSFGSDQKIDNEHSSCRATYPRDVVSSQPNSVEPVAMGVEIRNSPNSFKSKEPPISNR